MSDTAIVDAPHREITTDAPIRLSDTQRQAAIAAVASGVPQTKVAKQFGIHPNTLCRWMADVKKVVDSGLPQDWRSRLAHRLPALSVDAIEASVLDREDVHKAANTGIQVLKGIGVLAGDNSVNVTIQAVIASIPQEWRDDMILTPQVLSVSDTPIASLANMSDTPTGCVDLPTNGAPLIK